MGSKKIVTIKGLHIGGNNPVRVESMLKTPLTDTAACLRELEGLAAEGCELVRVSFPEIALKEQLAALAEQSDIPLMADIHFDHRLALAAIDAGLPSIRINPGNMGNKEGLAEVVRAAQANGIVIRIGANGGSLSNKQLAQAGGDRASALAAAVGEQVALLREQDFDDIIISAKSSNVMETVRANNILSQKYNYPVHIGITEAGPGAAGIAKGAAGLSLMLSQGVGDTLRVSLTAPGTEEVKTGYHILRALGMRSRGVELISCPTCGRKRVDVMKLTGLVQEILAQMQMPASAVTVAVMGCEVNGPREAAEADIGVAGTPDGFALFKKGKHICSGKIEELPLLLQNILKELS
ncbi:flavodoxin-dependent (E)-4-hydroxy-3-methylbut-2-enyl-diphosphate synthase [Synergistaceae bacterium OttesenSCG-928-D05]|nr:flavodoxin-dependent (E)-4-hydroxy-3-methylbut-2-enyl-diphosphate synthase [Synergistaceae bacterium OttesenSCG-928-D05]